MRVEVGKEESAKEKPRMNTKKHELWNLLCTRCVHSSAFVVVSYNKKAALW